MIVHVLNGNSEEYGLVKRGYFLPASKYGVSDIIKGYCSLFPGDYVPKTRLGNGHIVFQCNTYVTYTIIQPIDY